MLTQTPLPEEKASLQLHLETDRAALSNDVASQRGIRLLWTGLGFTILMLIADSAQPRASHASAESSRLAAEVAFNPAPALGPRGIHPARYPDSGYARPTEFLLGNAPHSKMSMPGHLAPLPDERIPYLKTLSMNSEHDQLNSLSDRDARDNTGKTIPYLTTLSIKSEHDQLGSLSDPDPRDNLEQTITKEKTLLLPGRVQLQSAAAVMPHPAKSDRKYALFPHCGGEDAYFIEDSSGVVGVADGVGGWAEIGIDPGLFSRQLMNFAAEEVRADGAHSLQDEPGEILQRAHKRTSAQGSSTALILAFSQGFDATWKVKAANLGDSGFVHVRGGELLFQSAPQQHHYNFPFQLGVPGGPEDSPTDAQNFELQDVRKGDVFVLGTDGVFDNAFGTEIAEIVHREELEAGLLSQGRQSFASKAAHEVALWASRGVAQDPGRVTPYAAELESYFHETVLGGKIDDITVVVVVVGADGKPAETSEDYVDPEVKAVPYSDFYNSYVPREHF